MSEYAVFWIIFAIVLGIVEAVSVNLVTIWFAVGAVAGFIAAIFTDSLLIQISVFVAVSLIALILTRPFAKNMLDNKKVPTNAARFIGAEGLVIEEIDEIKGSGQIKALGQVWSAKSADKSGIAMGETVIINKIEGVRAVVLKKNKED